MTKILLDPVLTAKPSKCSTTIQFAEFVKRTLEKRPDVFFYWIVPTHVSEEDFAWYPVNERIKYFRMPRARDRVRDYITLSPEFIDMIAFNGDQHGAWDFDVLLTVRAGLIPTMLLYMNSPRSRGIAWTRQVWLIEDMPMVSFKETVPNMIPDVHDRWTIEGHLAADKVFVCSYHEKPDIIRAAQKHFTPTLVRELQAKLTNVVTSQFEHYEQKTPEQMFDKKGEKQFGIAYIGRMEKANNIEEINDAMIKAWIPRGKKVRPIVCTVSDVFKTFDGDIVDLLTPNREEFWKIVQNDMHVFLKMPKGGGFSLSLIEPLMLGTPVVTVRSDMYESLLGKDYPFFADGPSKIAGLLKALYDDYPRYYAKFVKWQKEWFEPTYKKRMSEDLLYDHLDLAIGNYKRMLIECSEDFKSLRENEIVQRLDEHMKNGDKTIFEALRELGEKGDVGDMITRKLEDGFRHYWNITFSTPWHPIKLGLTTFYGYEDASTRTGHLKKIVHAS